MENYNPDGNDLQAISDFNEIFKNDLDITSFTNSFFLKYSLDLMKNAIENAVINGKITEYVVKNTYETNIKYYVNALMKMTNDVIDSNNCRDQFYNEINKAHLFRMMGMTHKGNSILNELEKCGLDSLEQSNLNYWKKVYEKDSIEYQIGINVLDSVIVIDTSNYITPEDIVINQFRFGSDISNINEILYPNCSYYKKSKLEILTTANQVFAYPNPSNNTIVFKVSGLVKKLNANITIFGIDGKILFQNNSPSTLDELGNINVSEWNNGLYTYKITFSNGELANGNFVVQK